MAGKTRKYFRYLNLPFLLGNQRTKEILHINPTIPERIDATKVVVSIYRYNAVEVDEEQFEHVDKIIDRQPDGHITWANVDGLRKTDVERIAGTYKIHNLLVEDILSVNQRPKMDEIEGVFYCLLSMLYFNDARKSVEVEQISIVLGKDFVLSFQEDPARDVFDPIRSKLKISSSHIRQRGADYLAYSMLDLIVDNYFVVMEKLGTEIEDLEEEVARRSTTRSLAKINQLRKELIVLKRNISPVRDLVNGIIRSESDLLDDRTTKYFKDVYDHIAQAHDLSENYRDVIMSLQDLYINNVNLKMNEVMKVMAIVTCLLAPATVIGGVFGMNFDILPFAHHQLGFYIALGAMLVIPIVMLWIFKKRGWF